MEAEVCALNDDQLGNLLSPVTAVLENITQDEKFAERLLDIYYAVDDSKILQSLDETNEFFLELLSLGDLTSGGDETNTALNKYLCKSV